jgi:putative aminopeptidase FrvX
MKELIQKLVQTTSPSGYEGDVRKIIQAEIDPLADEMRVDSLGSLIAVKGTQGPEGRRIMLAAHMDEIGLMVTHVDEKGYARFSTLGGVRPQNCSNARVRFLDGTLGVIGVEGRLFRKKMPDFDQMYIDTGASSREDCPVDIGDVASFERSLIELNGRLVAKSMDDRIGVAVLIETLRQIQDTPHQLNFVFSAQEEVGVRGATAAAYAVDPDIGLAVDVTGTGDTPRGVKMEVALGKGPAIKVRDRGMLADRRVVDWMIQTAEAADIPYQLEILEFGGTDARAIQLTRAGVPAGCLSIPCRYVHSPSEMVDYDDVQNAVSLLVQLLSQPVEL